MTDNANKNKDADLFDKRPSRSEQCDMCHGSGRRARGYSLVSAEMPITGAPVHAIIAAVVGCSDIFECTREALEMATTQHRPVAFDFSDRAVVVHPGDDANQIARAWWRETYNETPEQSWARR